MTESGMTLQNHMKSALFTLALVVGLNSPLFSQETPKPLRAGIVGLDTSHVPAFTKLFNIKSDGDLGSRW